MNIEKITSYEMDQNCYLVYDETGTGFLIDPGADIMKILKAMDKSGANITHILLTHCHYDHIYSVNELRRGRILVASAECSKHIGERSMNLSASCDDPFIVAPADRILADGEEMKIGTMCVKMIKTPGHTSCSVCYLTDGALFSGDTLFKRNVGRWDLPTGNNTALVKSIRERIFTLPLKTKVYPGHGFATDIEYEKKFNLYLS